MDKNDAIKKMEDLLSRIETLHTCDANFDKWHKDTEIALGHIFTEYPKKHIGDFDGITFRLLGLHRTEQEQSERFKRDIGKAKAILSSYLDGLCCNGTI